MGNQYVHIGGIISHIKSSGCRDFVVCPGSRNAPIIDFLTRGETGIKYSHIDERSAGYVALGIAKKTNKPVAIVCTSGTAALNLAPAMAEAYYQNICLIAITADRPLEAAHTFESQTINQNNIFQNFVATQISIDMSKKWTLDFKQKISNESKLAFTRNLPMHLNLHLSEPLYDFQYEQDDVNSIDYKIESDKSYFSSYRDDKDKLDSSVLDLLSKNEKVLMVLGFETQKEDFESRNANFPILSDPCSPNFTEGTVFNYDFFLGKLDEQQSNILQPQALITTGTYMLSKHLRNWLKKYPPIIHFHIGKQNNFTSPFTSNYKTINVDLNELISCLNKGGNKSFYKEWLTWDERYKTELTKKAARFSSPFYETLHFFLSNIETNKLHCGNSMAVRYGALFQCLNKKFETIVCNRGTSGIDGCISTFLGYAAMSIEKEWLLIGDISFFYDNNAFWLCSLPQNFVIIVINNGGGKIFDVISGPEKLERRKLFITNPHKKSVKHIAKMHKIKYHKVKNLKEAKRLSFEKKQRKIIEIFDTHPNTVSDYKKLYV